MKWAACTPARAWVDTIGLIIEPALVYHDGQLPVDPTARARGAKPISGWRAALAMDPEGTKQRLSRLLRNTCRSLMSRGMRTWGGCACDERLREDLRRRNNESQESPG